MEAKVGMKFLEHGSMLDQGRIVAQKVVSVRRVTTKTTRQYGFGEEKDVAEFVGTLLTGLVHEVNNLRIVNTRTKGYRVHTSETRYEFNET